MATSTQAEDVKSNHGEMPSPTPVTNIESPSTLQSSEMINKGSEDVQGSSSQNRETDDLHMPPLQIRLGEVELPPLTKSGQDSDSPRLFSSEIPDSEALSDRSSMEIEAKHDNAETDCGGRLEVKHIEEPAAHTRHYMNEIAAEILTTGTKGDEARNKLTDIGGDSLLVNNTSVAQHGSALETSSMPVTSMSAVSNVLCEETSQDVSVELKYSPGSLDINNGAEIDTLSFEIATHARGKVTILGEEPLAEVGASSIFTKTVQVCTPSSNERADSVMSDMIAYSMTKPSEIMSNFTSSKLNRASQEPQVSSEEKDNNVASAKTSQTKRGEDCSVQTSDTKPAGKPFKFPDGSPNKDAMITELKAMKIVGQPSTHDALGSMGLGGTSIVFIHNQFPEPLDMFIKQITNTRS